MIQSALTSAEAAVVLWGRHLIYHLFRFTDFTWRRSGARVGAWRLLRDRSIVGTPCAIYMHDLLPNGFHDGHDLDAIESTLRAGFGEPAQTFGALHAADDFGAG